MFTGLVEEVGRVRGVRPRGDGATITVEADAVLDGLKLGDSVAISGPCQTVIAFDSSSFTVEAIRETMERTRFSELRPGDPVNLERAMRPADRLGGHLVQGHVDGVVEVLDVRELAGSWRLRLRHDPEGKAYVVSKGSVALDGVSLTVAAVDDEAFEVEIIPHTWRHTTLHTLGRGGRVHAEWDLIAKYVRHMLGGYLPGDSAGRGGVTMASLIEAGFGPKG